MDPLSHADTVDKLKSNSYYRGFFDAEKRRKVVNHEPTPGQAIVGSIFTALPIVLIIYFVMRARTRLAEAAAGASKPDGFWGQMRKAVDQAMNPLGQKDFKVTVKDVKFKDVVGIPEALAEVRQYVDFLKSPEKFTRLGGRLPKGCILTGKPGTGKTLLAKAVAGEANVPFFTCCGADFIEVYAGSGPKRVRQLFEAAKEEAPSVIFIDEIDAVGSRSGGNSPLGLGSEENRTVNQLLAELDGLKGNEFVAVFAATNFVESLDKALLREGRFDRKVEIPMPDKVAREELFAHYLGKIVTTCASGQAKSLAELTPGVSPATIAAIVNEAALSAALKDRETVTAMDLLPAIDDVMIGKRHRNRMTADATKRAAVHESGHALVAWLLPVQSDVIKVSITPRGSAVGFTQQVGREVTDMPTEFSLFTDICVMLAGRLAELTFYDNLTTGAQDDFQRATQIAVQEFLAFGMSPQNVGLLSFEPQRLREGRVFQKHSEETQMMAEEEAARLIGAASDLVQNILHKHKHLLEKLSMALLERELLYDELLAILGPRDCKAVPISAEAHRALMHFTAKSENAALSRQTRCRASEEGTSILC